MTRNHHDTTRIDWAEMAPMLERGAELGVPLYRQAAAWLGELTPPATVRRILDVGSGPGVLTTLLAQTFPYADVVAVDAASPLLERARARAERLGLADRVQTVCAELPGDVGTLGEADLIWAGNALHHIGDQRAALAGFARLLRPGGLVALVEGGLTERHLPRDIGLGRPGLESRVEAARAEWFTEMRAELPGAVRETEDWQALLAAVGLTPGGARSFLLDIPAPVTPAVREHLHTVFTRTRDALEGRLADDDTAVLDRLLDPEDPQGLARRPDVYLLAAHTVHTARRG
ncbi:class I SAM-dependent methyltransferase [Streptomyces sp. MUM 178J]|uniref:class I SAM-dependent methyltransferase n=1 Tax=Streptomyces sp. MUM 178J TaxID=2791991 RepID=UPI001F03945F|nr:class I SAM-dependent methyltransferase [Streptomyces sp. MUM 178J]WRQ80210.1 class I SAM-dependent methyltransferase [Streptomyces sp. MUM 178J]